MSGDRRGALSSRLWNAAVVASLAVMLSLPSGTVVVRLSAAPGTETGGLSVATDPAGASVYVDGRLSGVSPLHLEGLGAGPHRVRVAKPGYLENSRIVAVAAGKPTVVTVNLTAGAATTRTAVAPGGSNKKWLILGVGVAAVGAAALALGGKKNLPPVVSLVTVSPTGNGMAGITNFSFTAAGASDPDGDALSYTWNFGDGGTGSGAITSHTFASPGTPTVTVTVSDGKKSAQASTTVTVSPNMTANWTGGRETAFGCSINWNLTQSGSNLTGTMTFSGTGCTGTVTGVTGTVNVQTHPATVNVTTPSYTFLFGGSTYSNLIMSFSGTTNAAGTTMTGNLRMRQTSSTYDVLFPATYNR